jgi:hypothetical protein
MFQCRELVKFDILVSKGKGVMKHPIFLDLTPYSLAELNHVLEFPAATFVTVCCTLQDVMSQKTASF